MSSFNAVVERGSVITLVYAAMAIAGEVSVRVRAKSMAIGFTYYFFSTAWSVPIPYLYNTTEANLGGKIGWILAGMGVIVLGIIFFFFEIHETEGRSFEELDEMFNGWVGGRSGIINAPRLSRCASFVRSDVGIDDIAHIYF